VAIVPIGTYGNRVQGSGGGLERAAAIGVTVREARA
jgi:hypothetical protein